MLKLLGSQKSGTTTALGDLEWLESIGKDVEITNFAGTYRCRVRIGDWDELMLSVCGKGSSTSDATKACADKMRGLLREGKVVL